MPDNPPSLPKRPFLLPGHRVVTLEGPDAVSFAQSQFMNDVAALAPGGWHWNGWLTPRGRLIALFALVRVDPQTLWLVLPDADTEALAAQLQRFVFRSKTRIATRQELRAHGAFAAPAAARGASIAHLEHGGVELDIGTAEAPRALSLSPRDDASDVDERLAAEWSRFDLEHGLPRLPASEPPHWTPQQLSLDRLNAFSVRKGCYPGQEIVARTHFLGKAKRGLVLLEAEAPIGMGEDVSDGSATLGSVIATVSAGEHHVALAVVGLDRAQPAVRVGSAPVREAPLRAGLER